MDDRTDSTRILLSGGSYEGVLLDQRVAEQLREMIMDGTLAPESQLPTEPELSSLLNVSRSTLRSALTILEQSGYILRRRGVGTFVAKNPPTYNHLNVNSGVTQLIRASGAQVGCIEALVAIRPAGERVAARLDVDRGSPVLAMERVRLANDRRVVFMVEYLPHSLFFVGDREISLQEIEDFVCTEQSMYVFLRERLGLEIHHGIAWLRPLMAESYLAEKLGVASGNSLLYLEQVDYDASGRPIALSDEYYVADAFTFSVYRTS
jgi:GntR family transcriptional regulator